MSDDSLLVRIKSAGPARHPVVLLPAGTSSSDLETEFLRRATLVKLSDGEMVFRALNGATRREPTARGWITCDGWDFQLGSSESGATELAACDRTDLTIPELRLLGPNAEVVQRVRLPVEAGQPVVIGRNQRVAQLVVRGDRVSRNHCHVVLRNGAYWVEDLGSKAGTMVNGESVEGLRELHHRDRIQVSGTDIEFWTFLEALDQYRPPAQDAPKAEAPAEDNANQGEEDKVQEELAPPRPRRAWWEVVLLVVLLVAVLVAAGWAWEITRKG